MHTCKKCGVNKPANQMAKFAGAPTETCLDCRWPSRKKDETTEPAADATEAAPPADGSLEIVVEASLGFLAKVDGEMMVITQQNSNRPEDPDNITLTRQEAKRLFGKFGGWANA